MVRTKSSMNYRVSMGKSPKVAACKAACSAGGSSSNNGASSSSSSKNKYSGGNPIHPRETPAWQKEITCFFKVKDDYQQVPANLDGESSEIVEAMQEAGPSGT